MREFGKITVLLLLLVSAVTGVPITEEETTETTEDPIEPTIDIILTTPPGCEGQAKPFEGELCSHCECVDWSGQWEWMCFMAMCARPPCDDSVTEPGQCCPTCPNGPNCNYNGVIIHVGETYVDKDGSACQCTEPNSYWEKAEVFCEPPMPPPTPSGCEGKDKPGDGACVHCECVEWGGSSEWECYMVDCFDAPCVDKITVPGQCCPQCPNGPNCEAGGVIIPLEETREISEGVVCHCSYETIWEPPIAVCDSMTTTPPPPPTVFSEEETPVAIADF